MTKASKRRVSFRTLYKGRFKSNSTARKGACAAAKPQQGPESRSLGSPAQPCPKVSPDPTEARA
jgi:hypothetical protein